MSLVSTRKPFDDLENTRVLLDTCTIIDASNCDDVDSYLRKMQDEGCTFLSLPAVREEFTCSAKGLEEYNKSLEYLNSLNIVFLNNTERQMVRDDNAIFNIALSRCKNIRPSFVDRMLLSTLYLYQKSSEQILLMTSNHKDVPKELFDRVGFISYDDSEFHNIGIYRFNNARFDKMVQNV